MRSINSNGARYMDNDSGRLPVGADGDDPAKVELEYVHRTQKAVLFHDDKAKKIWIPKSVILYVGDVEYDPDDEPVDLWIRNKIYQLEIKLFFAYEQELI